jgi:hypothetical protein
VTVATLDDLHKKAKSAISAALEPGETVEATITGEQGWARLNRLGELLPADRRWSGSRTVAFEVAVLARSVVVPSASMCCGSPGGGRADRSGF